MYPSIDKIKTILLQENYISEEDSKAAETASHDSRGYVDYLIQHDLLSRALLGQAIAEAYKIPFMDLENNPPGKENAEKIPETIARANRVVYVKTLNDKIAVIATDTPEKVDQKIFAPLFPKLKIGLTYTLPEYIEESFALYEQPLDTRFSQIIGSGKRVAPEIVDEIIKDAFRYRASDIHFEPQTDDVII